MITLVPVLNTFIFLFLAGLHAYWVLGGKWAMNVAIPIDSNGRKVFRPARVGALMVSAGLTAFALISMIAAGWLHATVTNTTIRYAVLIIGVIFLLRAVGDFRYFGIFKRHRRSAFAQWDSWLFSPLCLWFAGSHLIFYDCVL